MKRAYIDAKEGQMHYRFAGSGEPIILLHMSGSNSGEYEQTGNFLSENYTVYALDLIGFGGSDKPLKKYYTMDEHAQTVIAFMDSLGIESAYFVGNLVGATISLHIASNRPERVKGLFLASFGACYAPDYKMFQSIGRLPALQPISVADDGSHLAEMWARTAKYNELTEVVEARTLAYHIAGEWGESLHWALFNDVDMAEIFPKVKAPVMLITAPAENDVKMVELVCSMLPVAEYKIVDALNPFFSRKYPKEYSEMISAFFSNI